MTSYPEGRTGSDRTISTLSPRQPATSLSRATRCHVFKVSMAMAHKLQGSRIVAYGRHDGLAIIVRDAEVALMPPSPCRADEIGVAEAAYRMDGTEQQWLTGLAEAISPLLDTGHGIAAVHSRLDQALGVCSVAAFGGPPGLIEGVTAAARFGSRA